MGIIHEVLIEIQSNPVVVIVGTVEFNIVHMRNFPYPVVDKLLIIVSDIRCHYQEKFDVVLFCVVDNLLKVDL